MCKNVKSVREIFAKSNVNRSPGIILGWILMIFLGYVRKLMVKGRSGKQKK